MFCKRKKLGIREGNINGVEVNATNFNVNNIVKDKRNKKVVEVWKGQHKWEIRIKVLKGSMGGPKQGNSGMLYK